MFRINEITEELKKRGHEVEAVSITRNTVQMDGIRVITGSNVDPVIYPDFTIQNEEELIRKVEETIRAAIPEGKAFRGIRNVRVTKENVRVGVQRSSEEDILKRPTKFAGIEEYVYIEVARDNGGFAGTIRVKPDFPSDLTLEEMFECGEENIRSSAYIDNYFGFGPMLYLTANEGFRGAAAMLFDEKVEEVKERMQAENLFLLPSSIHEVLFVDANMLTQENADALVQSVNSNPNVMRREEILSDRAYLV